MNYKTITLLNGNTIDCEVGKPVDVNTDTEMYKNE